MRNVFRRGDGRNPLRRWRTDLMLTAGLFLLVCWVYFTFSWLGGEQQKETEEEAETVSSGHIQERRLSHSSLGTKKSKNLLDDPSSVHEEISHRGRMRASIPKRLPIPVHNEAATDSLPIFSVVGIVQWLSQEENIATASVAKDHHQQQRHSYFEALKALLLVEPSGNPHDPVPELVLVYQASISNKGRGNTGNSMSFERSAEKFFGSAIHLNEKDSSGSTFDDEQKDNFVFKLHSLGAKKNQQPVSFWRLLYTAVKMAQRESSYYFIVRDNIVASQLQRQPQVVSGRFITKSIIPSLVKSLQIAQRSHHVGKKVAAIVPTILSAFGEEGTSSQWTGFNGSLRIASQGFRLGYDQRFRAQQGGFVRRVDAVRFGDEPDTHLPHSNSAKGTKVSASQPPPSSSTSPPSLVELMPSSAFLTTSEALLRSFNLLIERLDTSTIQVDALDELTPMDRYLHLAQRNDKSAPLSLQSTHSSSPSSFVSKCISLAEELTGSISIVVLEKLPNAKMMTSVVQQLGSLRDLQQKPDSHGPTPPTSMDEEQQMVFERYSELFFPGRADGKPIAAAAAAEGENLSAEAILGIADRLKACLELLSYASRVQQLHARRVIDSPDAFAWILSNLYSQSGFAIVSSMEAAVVSQPLNPAITSLPSTFYLVDEVLPPSTSEAMQDDGEEEVEDEAILNLFFLPPRASPLSPPSGLFISSLPFRVVWDTTCCLCCGFNTEVSHYVRGLMALPNLAKDCLGFLPTQPDGKVAQQRPHSKNSKRKKKKEYLCYQLQLAQQPKQCYCPGNTPTLQDTLESAFVLNSPLLFGKKVERTVNNAAIGVSSSSSMNVADIYINHLPPRSFRWLLPNIIPEGTTIEALRRKLNYPRFIIARSMWESSRFATGSQEVVNLNNPAIDEIWVPAHFVRDVFLRSGVLDTPISKIGGSTSSAAVADRKRIVVVPEGIDTNFYKPVSLLDDDDSSSSVTADVEKLNWNPNSNPSLYCNHGSDFVTKKFHSNRKGKGKSAGGGLPFVFFSNFFWERRKGWDILFASYLRAFGDKNSQQHDDVGLLIVTNCGNREGGDNCDQKEIFTSLILTPLRGFIREHLANHSIPLKDDDNQDDPLTALPPFCVYHNHISEQQLLQVHRTVADAFVLTTHGEGWGLPLIQSMSCAKPVLATSIGGNTEFMNSRNSYLIPIDGMQEWEPIGNPGSKWAMPSINSTAALMRQVQQDPKAAEKVGRLAREEVVRRFDDAVVAQIVDKQIQRILSYLSEEEDGEE